MAEPEPKAFVVGHPIRHSRSPLIHGHWLERHGLAGSYERIDVPPEEFEAFLRGFGSRGYRGGNVTIPHKEAACRLADRVTDRARRLQAANTLWIENGLVHADNTDVVGYAASLDQALGAGWEQGVGTAVILGAGGAARAVAAALLDRGLAVQVANRTLERAEALRDLSSERISALPWGALPQALPRAGLLINTTSLGMAGQPPLELDLAALPETAIVSDIVYVPLETPLLAAARKRGLRTVDGLGMLLHQAVPGFARWFGVTPEVTPDLRRLIETDVRGKG